MNREKKKLDILDLKIDKSLKYMAAAFSGAFMHLTFLVIFLVIQLNTMAIFNVFSVTLYIIMAPTAGRTRSKSTPLRGYAQCTLK